MPIRITCPSCSATLSVKDEFAGRAVKCPKCGGVIPPQPAAPTASEPNAVATLPPPPPPPPAPPPEPEKLPLDEPEKPAKTGGKITGKPFARSKDRDGDDEDDRPRRKRRDDEDDRDEDRPRSRNKRDEDDRDRDDEDRPAKRRRDEDDDEDDRPGRGRKQKGKSNTGIVLAIIAGVLLLCCGSGIGLTWYVVTKIRDKAQEFVEAVEKSNISVNKANYDNLKVGTTTRTQAEQILRVKGKNATSEDVAKVFGSDANALDKWMAVVAKNRAVIWQNGEDYLIVGFHPDTSGDARIQMKEWKPKLGASAYSGEPSDAAFVQKYPPMKDADPKGPGKGLAPGTKVQAEDLTREFKTDRSAAAEKYTNKTFSVNGKLSDIEVIGGDMSLILEGADGMRVSCAVKKYQAPLSFNFARGQRLVIEGRCVGATAGSVSFNECSITSSEKDPAEQVDAAALVAAYRTDESGDTMFKGKQLRVRNAVIEKMMPDGILVAVPSGKKANTKKIRVEYDPNYRAITLTPPLRVGGSVTIRGLCEGVTDGDIVITGGWFLH